MLRVPVASIAFQIHGELDTQELSAIVCGYKRLRCIERFPVWLPPLFETDLSQQFREESRRCPC